MVAGVGAAQITSTEKSQTVITASADGPVEVLWLFVSIINVLV